MDRLLLAQKTHNLSGQLHPSDPVYKQWIFRYTFLELDKDLGTIGDITTDTLFSNEYPAMAEIVSHSEGIIAGLQEAQYFLVGSDPAFKPRISSLQAEFFKKDGEVIHAGDILVRIRGDVRDILKVERILLNLMQRMSGIATLTSSYTDLLRRLQAPILLTPTRKTLWGLLDKRAVVVGGGGTHRLNLSDAALIKDNHLALLQGNIAYALKMCAHNPGRFLEIEVENKDMAMEAAKAFARLHVPGGLDTPGVIMFDNMKPSVIRETVSAIRANGWITDLLLFEASGGIRLDTLEYYAKSGVDILSVGEITHSAASLDFSLEIRGT